MIYNFIYPLAEFFQPFNLFRYLTFRSIAAFLTALVISFIIGGGLIRWLRSKQTHGQPIREDGPMSHIVSKKGTPTMGGLLILIAVSAGTLLWADLTNRYVWIVLGVTVAFGAVGFWDDFLKVTKRNPKGVSGRVKLAISVAVAAVAAYFAAQGSPATLRYTVADTHHVHASYKDGNYDGRYAWVNDKINSRMARIRLDYFVCDKITEIPNIQEIGRAHV